MKKIFAHIQGTIIAGLILLIPTFVLIVLFQKIYGSLTGVGNKVALLFGIQSAGATSIATSAILVAIFYACGLLVKLAFVTTVKDWLEERILQYIPGYLSYSSQMHSKLISKVEIRTAVLARQLNAWRPGILVSKNSDNNVVFIPGSPETDKGEVWVVQDKDMQEIGVADKEFILSLQRCGKGLKIM